MNAGTLQGTTATLAATHPRQRQCHLRPGHRRHVFGQHLGGGSVTKLGIGTVTLSGPMNYAGGTPSAAVRCRVRRRASRATSRRPHGTSAILVQDTRAPISAGRSRQWQPDQEWRRHDHPAGRPQQLQRRDDDQGRHCGDSTTLQGDITDNATFGLSFDQLTDGSYGGRSPAAAAWSKFGAGTLILTGANSYTGGTTITRAPFGSAPAAAWPQPACRLERRHLRHQRP